MIIGAAALLSALAAGAVAQSTTDCRASSGTLTCRTRPDGFHALGQALRAGAQREKSEALFADALRSGRCDEARVLALRFGNAAP